MWSRIDEPYLYGYQAVCGRYKAEIIRVCAGRWQIFYEIGAHPCMPTYGLNHTFRFQTARKIAAQWLRKKGVQHVRR